MIELNSKLPSTQPHSFARTSRVNIERSVFDRSHGWKGTGDAGKLICTYMDEMVPGDTFDMQSSCVVQMQPLKVALMDNLFVDFHYWFVPRRLVSSEFVKMQGEQDDPGDSIDFQAPIVTWLNADGLIGHDSMFADMGIPQITPTVSLSVLAEPFRCVTRTWNTWYRDENLQDSKYSPTDAGPDTRSEYVDRLPRGKRHDYFTSALPWVQKGDPVSLPLGTSAPVSYVDSGTSTNYWLMKRNTDDALLSNKDVQTNGVAGLYDGTATAAFDPQDRLIADLSTATAATINDLRFSNMVQELLELDARGGTRYTEIIRAHFGVTSPDARLQRPEFLGGWSMPLQSNLVPQTSPTSGSDAQAGLAAYTRNDGGGKGFTYSATEHGWVFCLASIRADINYQQGLRKMWSKRDRYDLYMPVLAHLGEQPIPNKEIYAIGDDGTQDDAVFGYQEAWADYRYMPSIITGKLNSNATGTLDLYHVAQDFGALPVLDSDFIEEDPAISRVVAITTEPPFILDVYHKLRCTRPIPVFSIPQLSSRI